MTATVEGANESQEYLNNLYKNGLTGKAALEYTGDLSPDHKKKTTDAFQNMHPEHRTPAARSLYRRG